MNFFVSVVDVRGRIEWELWEVGTYNWRHMPHGDAGGCCQGCLVGGIWGEGGQGGGGGREMVVYAPGGVMSVATASALNVEWPPVYRKETC